jgi:hypothetical protein
MRLAVDPVVSDILELRFNHAEAAASILLTLITPITVIIPIIPITRITLITPITGIAPTI